MKQPNVVFVFSDQQRAQSVGYACSGAAFTPCLDALCRESVNFCTAVSGNPVCCPYRAGLLTGQYPLTHGVFTNDVSLDPGAVTMGKLYKKAGYDTAYIGKWHVDGHGRSAYIPPERRQGFDFWRVLECTHDYNHSPYYADGPEKRMWEGYDAAAQTRCAADYIRDHEGGRPFLMVLSYGPPHNPYDTAPKRFRDLYDPAAIPLRPNVPEADRERAARDLAGYYAHVSALDELTGELLCALDERGLAEDTVFVYTSDHGDMLFSHGQQRKQKPYDESILVPFLLRYPAVLGRTPREIRHPVCTQDILPTLLGLCGLPVPDSVEGIDLSGMLRGEEDVRTEAALLESIHPFGEWHRGNGGREYRGVRTERYTYVRDLSGPWLLFDNREDPYQMRNLCGDERYAPLQRRLSELLSSMLAARGDRFLPGMEYIKKWGYPVDGTGTVPYTE